MDYVRQAFFLLKNVPADRLVACIRCRGGFVSEAVSVEVDEHAVIEGDDRRLYRAGAWIDRLGVETAEITAGRRSCLQAHTDALAAVEIAALCNRPGELRLWAAIAGQHFRVALKPAARQHDRLAAILHGTVRSAGFDADNGAVFILNQAACGGLIIDGDVVSAIGFAPLGQRLHQCPPATDRSQARRRNGQKIDRQIVEFRPFGFQPAHRWPRAFAPSFDQGWIERGLRAQQGLPIAVGAAVVLGHFRVQITRRILCQPLGEIVGNGVLILHSPEGLGVTGVAAPVFFRRALQHMHARAGFGSRGRCRQAGNAATDDDDVGLQCS